MRNFRELTIWNQGIELAVRVYKLTQQLPKEELYGLKSQINRSCVSIASNIAEGCSRSSEKEYSRFLEIALGSSFELETDLIIAQKLNLIHSSEVEIFLQELQREQKMINSLIGKIKISL